MEESKVQQIRKKNYKTVPMPFRHQFKQYQTIILYPRNWNVTGKGT